MFIRGALAITIGVLALCYQNCSNRKVDDVTAVTIYGGTVFSLYESDQVQSVNYWESDATVLVNGFNEETHDQIVFDHEAKNLEFERVKYFLNADRTQGAMPQSLCAARLPVDAYNKLVQVLVGSVLVPDKTDGQTNGVRAQIAITDLSSQTTTFGFETVLDDFGDKVIMTPSDLQAWFAETAKSNCP